MLTAGNLSKILYSSKTEWMMKNSFLMSERDEFIGQSWKFTFISQNFVKLSISNNDVDDDVV